MKKEKGKVVFRSELFEFITQNDKEKERKVKGKSIIK